MITITQTVEEFLRADDVALAAAAAGWLNLSSYARSITPAVAEAARKPVSEASVVTALSRLVTETPAVPAVPSGAVRSLAIHSHLVGLTYERTDATSSLFRSTYQNITVGSKTFITATQGINEITIVAETAVAAMFRRNLPEALKIYDKPDLVGITAQFAIANLETPNLIFGLTRRLAHKNINIIEVVSTATELTFIVEKADLKPSLDQLQKDL